MIFWAVALLVWVAAGARLGRVVARTATPLRMSMVFAGFSVALSSTVMVPAVWDIVDRIAPEQHAAAMIVIVLWTALSAASAVGAVSAWPVMSRPAMRGLATVLYSVGLLVAIAVLFGYPAPALIFIIVALSLVISTGLRHVAWAPLGRGIALIVTGSSILLVVVVVMLVESIGGTGALESDIWTGRRGVVHRCLECSDCAGHHVGASRDLVTCATRSVPAAADARASRQAIPRGSRRGQRREYLCAAGHRT